MSQRRVVSRRVVKRRVLGSANPVAKWGRDSKNTCFDSLGGFFIGLLLFFVPFWLAYSAATTEKDSKDVKRLDVVPASAAAAIEGKALIEGTVMPASALSPRVVPGADLLAFRYVKEKYEEVEKTRTETRTEIENGQEVEYTEEITELVWEWVPKEQDERWASLLIDSMPVDRTGAYLDLPWESAHSKEWKDAQGAQWREREEVVRGGFTGLYASEFDAGRIVAEPDFKILTNRNKDELVAHLHSMEEGMRWGKLAGAVVLMMVSFNLMLGPAMILINIFPVKQLGCAARALIAVVSLVASVIIVGFTYAFVRYWWVVILLLLGLAVWVIMEANKNRGSGSIDEGAPA